MVKKRMIAKKSNKKQIKNTMHIEKPFLRPSTKVESKLRDLANHKIMYFQSLEDYKDRPSWNEIFMQSAYEAATRASCIDLKTGAVIVKDKRVRASGYNGAPSKIENCLERGCRKLELRIELNHKGTGNCRGAHAEVNAMSQLAREDLIGSSLYSVFFPCSDCAKKIVGNGIIEVYYSMIYQEPDSLTNELFQEKGIKLKYLDLDVPHQFIRLMRIYNQRFKKRD